jgi:hypothetical protein
MLTFLTQIRTNFYATIFLITLTPENEKMAQLVNRLYENSVFYGLALVLAAVIQTLQKQLDLYHAIFVMQIIFSLNFVYSYGVVFVHSNIILKPLIGYENAGMRKFMRGPNSDSTESRAKFRRMKIIIGIQTFTTLMFTIWLLYVWVKDSRFGSQPECNHLVKYVFFFANIRATETWLRVLFIIYLVFFSFTLLFRFCMIFFVYVDRYHKPQDESPMAGQKNDLDKKVYTYLKTILSVG